MMNAALISVNTINGKFHEYAEQLTNANPSAILQEGRRPRSKIAYLLSYLKIFSDPQGNPNDISHLTGFLHLGILVAGGELDIAEVTGSPHGLYCVSCPITARTGVAGVVFMGTLDQWKTAISNALRGSTPCQEWGRLCHSQLVEHGLEELVGSLEQKGGNLFLTN